jgi:hypothetical protein
MEFRASKPVEGSYNLLAIMVFETYRFYHAKIQKLFTKHIIDLNSLSAKLQIAMIHVNQYFDVHTL